MKEIKEFDAETMRIFASMIKSASEAAVKGYVEKLPLPKKAFSVNEAAEMLSVAPSTIDRQRKLGLIHGHKIGDRLVSTADDLEEFLDICREGYAYD
jgi:ribosomal protein S20